LVGGAGGALLCRDGWLSLFLAGIRRRPIASRIAPAAGDEHGLGDGCERQDLGGGAERCRFAALSSALAARRCVTVSI
jgi:hypothetical protein